MKKVESLCVGCSDKINCKGSSCSYWNCDVYYCDKCGCDDAIYSIDQTDYCEDCAEQYIQEKFDKLNIYKKAELLSVEILDIDI